MTTNVFTYGTLMMPTVMQTVCDSTLESIEACLEGYARVSLNARVYPALVARPDFMVDGVLYTNVSPDALKRLDFFEGQEYIKQNVTVELNNKKKVEAITYIINPKFQNILTTTPWNFKEFKDKHLSNYLKQSREQMRNYR